MSRLASTRSSSSASSIGHHTAASVTTENTGPSADQRAPSTATTSSIADCDPAEAVKPAELEEATPAPLQPAPVPAVNVWALRKEKMAQAQAASVPAPSTASSEVTPPPKATSLGASTQKPEQALRGAKAPASASDHPRPATHHQRDTSKPGGAIAVGVSATSVPVTSLGPARAVPPVADASSWPTPVEESNSAPTAPLKKVRSSTEEDAKASDTAKTEKKKGARSHARFMQ
jgi:la-related protein 1